MKIIFYQANFCAECGNAIKPRFSWGPRYFCDECEARMKPKRSIKPLALLIVCASLAVFALNRTQPPLPATPSNSSPSVSIPSARDASALPLAAVAPPPVERVMCGARTKKGTPCKRLVLPGQRCAQHRGRASRLDETDKSP